MAGPRDPQMGTLKSVSFRLAALVLPLVILVLIEVILRLFGVEEQRRIPFYRLDGKEDYVAFNPDFAKRYFRRFEPGVAFNPFLPEKPDSVFRVFVLGGSSAAGYPYGFMYGFPARLESRLEAYLPGRRIEVINLAMTAVNSYTLWHLTGYLLEHQPDAVVVYAGHNEYYGAFGAGSTIYSLGNRVWLKRMALRLKGTVLFTLLERLIMGQPDVQERRELETRTMMAQVVGERSIELDGDIFRAGIEQFEANLGDVLGQLRDAGVATYVGTVASNLRDQAPLGQDSVAAAAFAGGVELASAGDSSAARTAFVRAREYDDVRFRAPAAINDVIRRVADQTNATLVDTEALLRQASKGGIEGADLFVDHLHPTFRGYDLMAAAFDLAMRSHPVLMERPRLMISIPEPVIDPLDEASATIQLARLRAGYPFRRDVTPEIEARFYSRLLQRFSLSGRYADSLAVQSLERVKPVYDLLYEGARMARDRSDTLNALLFYRALMYWQPFNEALAIEAVDLAIRNARFDELSESLSRFSYNRTGALFPLDALAAVSLRRGRLDDAERLLDASELANPEGRTMLFNRARLLVLRGDTARARAYFQRYARGEDAPAGVADSALVRSVLTGAVRELRRGRYVGALALVDSAAGVAGGPDADVYFTRGLVLLELGRLEGAAGSFRSVIELDPEYRGVWHNLGNTAYRATQFRAAVKSYRRAAKSTGEARSYHALGGAYDQLGHADSARWAYEMAVDVDDRYAPAHMSLAEWYEDAGDFEAALAAARRATGLDPGNMEFASVLGRLEFRAGRLEEAVRTLSSAAAASPWDYNARFNLGQSLARLGRRDEAAEALARADEIREQQAEVERLASTVRQMPEDFDLWIRYAGVLRDTGRLDEAIRAYEIASALRPGNLSVRTNIATLHLNQGRAAEALSRYDEILAEDSTVAEVWANLAVYYASRQQPQAAGAALDRLREIEPGHPVLSRFRRKPATPE